MWKKANEKIDNASFPQFDLRELAAGTILNTMFLGAVKRLLEGIA